MRARDRYLGTKDVQEILGVGRTKANEIMNKFKARGQMFRVGKLMRVRESDFNNWLKGECFQPIPYSRGKRRSA